jgi:hypothetical protein
VPHSLRSGTVASTPPVAPPPRERLRDPRFAPPPRELEHTVPERSEWGNVGRAVAYVVAYNLRAMVIQQRTELARNRILYILCLVLAVAALIGVVSLYSSSGQTTQLLLMLVALAAIAAIGLVVVQLYSFPKRSHALLIQREGDFIIATNAVHEGFKLRFLRDVLSENVFSFSDEDREKYKTLEEDGYYPVMLVRSVRKVLLLRLCTMIFDDVYFVDNTNRWEHHDSSSTPEPSFHKREMPPLRLWKQISS